MSTRTMGVEEEFLLVDPDTGEPQAIAGAVMRAAAADESNSSGGSSSPQESHSGDGSSADGEEGPEYLEFELQKQQVEINTEPCTSLDELRAEVARCRGNAAAAVARAGAGLLAVGTSPMPADPSLTLKGRYLKMGEDFGLTAHEQLTCGCHVHVQVMSDEEGVAVLDRMQPWLPTLLALSANSPFWQGTDSSYASFRYQAWGRWPCSGPTPWFGSARAYAETVQAMIGTGTVLDAGMVYFNARLSEHYPTIEVRVADVCLFPDDAVLIAALVRALVETEARSWREEPAGHPVRPEILSLAAWRASRSGLEDVLVHPATGRPAPAPEVAAALLEHVRPALEDSGDLAAVSGLLDVLLGRGNGARFQREAYGRSGSVLDVVGRALEQTAPR